MARVPLVEIHVALIGMTGCGKSALAVKYIAKRFIGEYDPELEETYCRQDTIMGQPLMVWLMDTVDGSDRDELRYLSWADVYIVVYDISSQLSLQYAKSALQQISMHEHHLCSRQHKCLLVGNKSDLERYRQVNESDGERLAKCFGTLFGEISATADYERIEALIRRPIASLISDQSKRHSPSPRLYSSDSECVSTVNESGLSASIKTSGFRSKSQRYGDAMKLSTSSTFKKGNKLLKLFHN